MQTPSHAVQESLIWLTESLDQVLDETVHLCCIPAPTFEEAERAAYVAARMRAIGLSEVRIDSIHNVTNKTQVHELVSNGCARPRSVTPAAPVVMLPST